MNTKFNALLCVPPPFAEGQNGVVIALWDGVDQRHFPAAADLDRLGAATKGYFVDKVKRELAKGVAYVLLPVTGPRERCDGILRKLARSGRRAVERRYGDAPSALSKAAKPEGLEKYAEFSIIAIIALATFDKRSGVQ